MVQMQAELSTANSSTANAEAALLQLQAALSTSNGKTAKAEAAVLELQAELASATVTTAQDVAQMKELRSLLQTADQKTTADASKYIELQSQLVSANDKGTQDAATIAELQAQLNIAAQKGTDDNAMLKDLAAQLASANSMHALDAATVAELQVEVSNLKGQLTVEQMKNITAEQRLIKAATALASTRRAVNSAKAIYEVSHKKDAAMLVRCQTVGAGLLKGLLCHDLRSARLRKWNTSRLHFVMVTKPGYVVYWFDDLNLVHATRTEQSQ